MLSFPVGNSEAMSLLQLLSDALEHTAAAANGGNQIRFSAAGRASQVLLACSCIWQRYTVLALLQQAHTLFDRMYCSATIEMSL